MFSTVTMENFRRASFSVATSKASASWLSGDTRNIVAGAGNRLVAAERASVAGFLDRYGKI
jgi:hypothetical protein